jgi:hypothetical protein
MDRAEVRILRVEIQPGAVRRVHTHDDVRFHLFLPLSGAIELTIASAKPVKATVGQAYYLEKGARPTGSRTPAHRKPWRSKFLSEAGAPWRNRRHRHWQ